MTRGDLLFEAWIAKGRAVSCRAELVRRGLWTRAMAGDSSGPCPGCGGEHRFAVNVKKNVFLCRKSGVGGDAIALVQHIDGSDFLTAIETLTGEPRPVRDQDESEAARVKTLEDEAKVRAMVAAREARERAADGEKYRTMSREKARRLWLSGQPIAGTLGEAYLAKRGVLAPRAARLKFHPELPLYAGLEHDGRHGRVRPVHAGPCLLAAIQAADHRLIGVQRIWIDLDQPKGHVRIPNPAKPEETLPAKKTLGSKGGGSIRLCGHAMEPPYDSGATDFYLGEGVVTTLAVWTALAPEDRVGAEFHAGVDLGNIAGKALGRAPHPTLTTVGRDGRARPWRVPDDEPHPDDDTPMIGIPRSVRRLILLGDGDSEAFFTAMAMRRAARRFAKAYPWLEVRLAMAEPDKDFAKMLEVA
jgi:hypothetical protein